MSETNTETGKLIKYQKEKETVNECCKRILEEKDIKDLSYNETPLEFIQCELSGEFFVHHWVYKIENFKSMSGEDICELSVNDDNSIDFVVQYYNGGTCLEEMLEYGINKLKECEMKENENEKPLSPNQVDKLLKNLETPEKGEFDIPDIPDIYGIASKEMDDAFDMPEIDDNPFNIYTDLCKEKYKLIQRIRKISQRINEIERNMIV